MAPEDPTSDARAAQVKQFQEGQRLAGYAITQTRTPILGCHKMTNCAQILLDIHQPLCPARKLSELSNWRTSCRS